MRASLFLNLEGVCHPRGVVYSALRGAKPTGPLPFCWVESLRGLLERWDTEVILRSSSVTVHGLEAISGLAPAWLQERIVGKTTDVIRHISLDEVRKVNSMWGVIRRHVAEHKLTHWVSLGDDDDGWPSEAATRRHLVLCDGEFGLADPEVLTRLEAALLACRP